MQRLNIKPISVNDVWMGRQFKTQMYRDFENEAMPQLKGKLTVDKKEKIHLMIHFGVSPRSDLDNCLKGTIDVLSKKYGFNDKQIFKITASKETVKKGAEFIAFDFKEHKAN